MTNSVRRSMAVLALGAALATTGCGVSSADRAATVDGTVITETEVQTSTRELNALKPTPFEKPLTTTATLGYLLQAQPLIDEVGAKGVVVSESVASALATQLGLKEPSDGTILIIRSLAAQSSAAGDGKWTDADQAALVARQESRVVTVNPRYGRFDPKTATITAVRPSWITSTAAPQ